MNGAESARTCHGDPSGERLYHMLLDVFPGVMGWDVGRRERCSTYGLTITAEVLVSVPGRASLCIELRCLSGREWAKIFVIELVADRELAKIC